MRHCVIEFHNPSCSIIAHPRSEESVAVYSICTSSSFMPDFSLSDEHQCTKYALTLFFEVMHHPVPVPVSKSTGATFPDGDEAEYSFESVL